jgi:hypothetical protein
MFVKGTPEFVKKPDDAHDSKGVKKQEPWPEGMILTLKGLKQ